jgi:hypothetical protein
MNDITIPADLASRFAGSETSRVRDEQGVVLGYYTPLCEGTDEDYEWAFAQITPELIEASEKSGSGRPLAEALAELRQKYGP